MESIIFFFIKPSEDSLSVDWALLIHLYTLGVLTSPSKNLILSCNIWAPQLLAVLHGLSVQSLSLGIQNICILVPTYSYRPIPPDSYKDEHFAPLKMQNILAFSCLYLKDAQSSQIIF